MLALLLLDCLALRHVILHLTRYFDYGATQYLVHCLLGEALGLVDCLADLAASGLLHLAVLDPGRRAHLHLLSVSLLLVIYVAGLLELLLAIFLLVRLVFGHVRGVAPGGGREARVLWSPVVVAVVACQHLVILYFFYQHHLRDYEIFQ